MAANPMAVAYNPQMYMQPGMLMPPQPVGMYAQPMQPMQPMMAPMGQPPMGMPPQQPMGMPPQQP